MKWWTVAAVFLSVSGAPRARADESRPQRDLGAEARAVFAARCAHCHGPDVVKPRGRFGYVLDLARVAENPEMVIPHKPDESELWELIRRGDMPPEDSPTGALTEREKETIRAWIAVGAPAAATSPGDSQAETPAHKFTAPAPTAGWRLILWLGKYHFLALHFPIALLVAAALAEGWAVWRGARVPLPAVRFCLLFGAVSAVVTAALGWLLASSGFGTGMPRILTLHRWLGTTAGAWAVLTAVFSEWDAHRGERHWLTRVLLFAGAALVGVAAHFGGVLVHGADFLDW